MDLNNISVEQLGLSVRASNVLQREGIHTLGAMLECTEEQLTGFRNSGPKTVKEILEKAAEYRSRIGRGIEPEHDAPEEPPPMQEQEKLPDLPLSVLIMLPQYRETALRYAKSHDVPLEALGLAARPLNRLVTKGCAMLSDILFLTELELKDLPSMGLTSVQNVLERRNAWMASHEYALCAALAGDESALLPPPPQDGEAAKMILHLYDSAPYAGLSLQDLTERLPDNVSAEQLKRCVGGLLAEGKLEYVDFRCYRVYPPFALRLAACEKVSERNRALIADRLSGQTLEAVGRKYDLTRERVRQITKNSINTVRSVLEADSGMGRFDEDYFLYFYQTYQFDKRDAAEWFGLSPASLSYLALMAEKGGSHPLEEAPGDPQLGVGLRQRVRNYLNRDKLFLDGQWIPKKRAELEEYVVTHLCRDSVSFSEFTERYNAFLCEHRVPYDVKIYYSDAVLRTRKNRLSEAHFLLWKHGEMLRAYDVDGRSYEELFAGLRLDEYENIELSTWKLFEENPELMVRYDLRDHYELHNLLRKVLPDGSFHDLKIEHTPNICFGSFDRDAALLDLMVNNAPISQTELAELIRREYGYDPGITIAGYLVPLSNYYHRGIYSIDQKTMTAEHQKTLLTVLEDDFYYIDELKHIYSRLVPGADTDEINPYNLKQMGFTVLSRYAFRNYDSLDALLRDMLTRSDLLDISELRKRFTYAQAFSAVLNNLKRELEIMEYEPNRLISIRKLNSAGVERSDLTDFCDAVYAYLEDGAYFTAKSLRLSGFSSEFYELGFSDWFYGSLLRSDPRFSYCQAYKTIILRKGTGDLLFRDFETALIREAGSIDVYDLQRELEETYGCIVPDRLELFYMVAGSKVFRDRHMDRLYDSEERYWREVDETEVSG